jgi:predicted component of type VI protein secretion system
VFRQGRLEPRNPEAGSVVQTLGLKPVSIGSDSTCDLQLTAPGIAKRHVDISMTRAGFNVRDSAASGSVKINGSVIQEQVLSEGDTLSLGPAQFNFRLL